MADAIEDDLRDRAFAVVVLASSFVIDRAREALEGLLARVRAAFEGERLRGGVGALRNRDLLVDLKRLLRG